MYEIYTPEGWKPLEEIKTVEDLILPRLVQDDVIKEIREWEKEKIITVVNHSNDSGLAPTPEE